MCTTLYIKACVLIYVHDLDSGGLLHVVTSVRVQYVTGKDIERLLCAEPPPRHQLDVDLVASLQLQHHHLRDETGVMPALVSPVWYFFLSPFKSPSFALVKLFFFVCFT